MRANHVRVFRFLAFVGVGLAGVGFLEQWDYHVMAWSLIVGGVLGMLSASRK